MSRRFAPLLTLCSLILYWTLVAWHDDAALKTREHPPAVVVNAPLQVLLLGGDRFLAANIEAVRAAASATTVDTQNFRLRAHQEASRLNPCHEDNYWIGNASLSWGGAPAEGFQLLANAVRCRFWDEWPPFFYGFNQHFFRQDTSVASQYIDLAAERSKSNTAIFRTFSLMLKAGESDDIKMALNMLAHERDNAKDPKLKEMLNKRVIRLNGLLILRDAQAAFEKRFKRPLREPHELIQSGILDAFPEDPLKLGYTFNDHSFQLHQMAIE